MTQYARSNSPRNKIEIYLRFFIYRTVTRTRGATVAQRTVSGVLKQVSVAAQGLFWLAKNRKKGFCVVACSGEVSMSEGRLKDEKIDYFLSTISDAMIYIGNPAPNVNYEKIDKGGVLIPLLVSEAFFLPLTFFLIFGRLRELLKIKRRHNLAVTDTSRLALKYATKISKSWFLYFLAKLLPVQRIIINDGYAQNIEMVDMGNRLGLETIEVQHGIIAYGHYGYSDSLADYPSVVPSRLVVWNKSAENQVAWREQASVVEVSRPSPFVSLCLEAKRIIIIGQPSIQAKLVELYTELHAIYPGAVKYRPHPRESNVPVTLMVDERVAFGDIYLGGFSTMLMDLREHVTDDVYSLESLIPEGYMQQLVAGRVTVFRELAELKNVLAEYQFSSTSST